jgi:Holliday junction resolvase RusA-like endonuclease
MIPHGKKAAMAFELISARKPFSVNNKGKKFGGATKGDFIASLQHDAVIERRGRQLLDGELYARIIWFHLSRPGDPDNIIKPILDALKGVFYADDALIVKVLSERFNLHSQTIRLSATTTPPVVFDALVDLIGESHEHILFIEIGNLPSRDLSFGPIQ